MNKDLMIWKTNLLICLKNARGKKRKNILKAIKDINLVLGLQ